ncbi:vacuolar fusion protein CCZ1 homolog [Amphibalanus amphitrite]|uniref:vacuolar fusion protein CCZ1 homolog n=1 Tax=Amphibalanus amphitrite TaxID=1232801 RepID=UPI001C8FAA01|nr:vacuolar fusion protein CCZ1 homolog [Amphibalanus amphitrite]
MSSQQNAGVELCSFFIFNSTFGPREGEEENKIIYYHPPSVDINSKVKDVGLVEALVQFSRTFNSESPLLSMQTLKQKHFFLEPEKDFFMTLVVRQPVEEVTRNNSPYKEYTPEAVQQSVYLSVLRHMYQMYRLLRGTLAAQSRDELVRSTAEIFDSYVPVLRLQQRDIRDVYGGVRFLSLDRLAFLKLQSFVNQLEVLHPFIRHSVIYYKQHLIWSGLGKTNMGIIHWYLETVLFPECGPERPAVWKERTAPTSGVFMSTEASGDGTDSFLAPPIVHLRKHNCTALPLGGAADGCSRDGDDSWNGGDPVEATDERAQLVLYRLRDVVVVLLVDLEVRLTLPLCRELDASMAGPVQELSTLLSSAINDDKSSGKDDGDTKLIYYNRCNRAQKSSLHGPTAASVPSDALQLMVDLREDALRFQGDGGAIFGRAMNETWVAGRVNPNREFFSVVQQKNMNLMDVNNEMEQLCKDQFSTIFFPA